MSRRLIRFTCEIKHGCDDLLIVPAGRKLGLARLADSMPVAAAGRVAIEYVCGAFGTDADGVRGPTPET